MLQHKKVYRKKAAFKLRLLMEKTRQRDYLFEKGVIENSTPEALEDAKKTHKKNYQKEYQQAYKKTVIRKEIHLSAEESLLLEKAALKHKMKLRPFMKECIFAYLKKTFVEVDDDQLKKVLRAINRVGNNVNQIAFQLNRGEVLDKKEVLKLVYGQLERLENEVQEALSCPPTLEGLFAEAAKKDARAIDRLEELIHDFRTKNK